MLGWFLETSLVAAGLAAVAALGGRLRSVGPTARHALWLVVLVRMVTPPLFCWPWAADWGRSVRLSTLSAASREGLSANSGPPIVRANDLPSLQSPPQSTSSEFREA